MGTPNRGGFGGAVGRAGTTRKRAGAAIADTRAVRGGLGYGGSEGSGTPAGHLAVVDDTLAACTQEAIKPLYASSAAPPSSPAICRSTSGPACLGPRG